VDPLRSCHWTFDGIASERPGEYQLRLLIKELVREIGMTPITPEPMIVIEGQNWQAFQVIAESHISIEGKGDAVYCDIFSCKPFDAVRAHAVLNEHLRVERWEVAEIKRGTREPVA
jgi:S-adenosylmethionine/arginine decarboxylase-like enzyme